MTSLCLLMLINVCVLFSEASIYHQSDYIVKVHRLEVINYNRTYLKDLHAGYDLYNRTQRAFNVSVNILKEVNRMLRAEVQLYKFLSNEYRFFPITLNFNEACKDINLDPFGIRESLQKAANHPLTCPFKPGFFTIRYGLVDFSKFPPFIPKGDYKMECKLYDHSNFLVEIQVFANVEEILKKFEY